MLDLSTTAVTVQPCSLSPTTMFRAIFCVAFMSSSICTRRATANPQNINLRVTLYVTMKSGITGALTLNLAELLIKPSVTIYGTQVTLFVRPSDLNQSPQITCDMRLKRTAH